MSVPVSRFHLILSKIIVGYGLVIIESIFSFLITLIIAVVMRCPDVGLFSGITSFKQILIVSTCCYIAVLPIIIIFSQKKDHFLSGVIFAFFYGFCGIFLAARRPINLYPVTTGLVLSNYVHEEEIIYKPILSLAVNVILVFVSFILLGIFNRKHNDM